MLVLTRKLNEVIKIGENIEIKVVSIDGEQIKLGIEAPAQIEIHRKEVYMAIQETNKLAVEKSVNIQALKEIHLPKSK